MVGLLLLFFLFFSFSFSIDNGLARTPAMGYNTWNDFRCHIKADDIKAAADALIEQGLHRLGFVVSFSFLELKNLRISICEYGRLLGCWERLQWSHLS